jgi:hypothetical protein
MFATLVIALPSKHEGGEVRVTHDGKTKTFETSKFSEFDSSYLAWYDIGVTVYIGYSTNSFP